MAGPEAKLYFNVRFEDFDRVDYGVNCPDPGPVAANVPEPIYNIQFTTNDVMESSFNVAQGMVGLVNRNSLILVPAEENNGVSNIYTNETVELYISPDWTAADGDITITATVTDLSMVPQGDMGDVEDNAVNFQWIIQFTDQVPDSLQRIGAPQIGTYFDDVHDYTYQGLPDVPPPGQPDYLGVAVIEVFKPNEAGFTLNDLLDGWRADNPVPDADQVAQMLFRKGQNATFQFNIDFMGGNTMDDRFTDRHTAPFFNTGSLNILTVFKENSILDNRVRIRINQQYFCNGKQIGEANILKRLFIPPPPGGFVFQVRKDHLF